MRILLVGKGGRESALAAKIMESPATEVLFMAPEGVPGSTTLDISPFDFQGLADAITANQIDTVVVGSELPIVEGITDALQGYGAQIIAPSKDCARLEGSKEFAKEFMFRNAIPTARFMTVTSETIDEGYAFLESLTPPYVLKADGLASGRGVIITDSLADAKDTLTDMIEGLFDEASHTVVVEEYLHGCEATVMLATDGFSYCILPSAKDYKRLGENGSGPNTAGMGSVSPVSFMNQEFMEKVEKRIIIPTLQGLRDEGMEYKGFLSLGIIKVEDEPMLIEYNVRLGDTEAEAVLPRIESDFTDIFKGISGGTLNTTRLEVTENACVAIAVTCEGFPENTHIGERVEGLASAEKVCRIFPAMIRRTQDGFYVVAGERVAIVSAMAPTVEEAAKRAICAAELINFPGRYFRRDIGTRIEEPN